MLLNTLSPIPERSPGPWLLSDTLASQRPSQVIRLGCERCRYVARFWRRYVVRSVPAVGVLGPMLALAVVFGLSR